MVNRSEGVRNTDDTASILVQLSSDVWTIIGYELLGCSLFEDPVGTKSYVDVETGGKLQRDDFRELGYNEDESISGLLLRRRTQEI